MTYRATTLLPSSEHPTPNQEQGSSSPSTQFDKAPNGSTTTLSLNLNRALPKKKSQQIPHKNQTLKQNPCQKHQKDHTFIIQTIAKIQTLAQETNQRQKNRLLWTKPLHIFSTEITNKTKKEKEMGCSLIE